MSSLATWTIRGKLPDPSLFEDPFKRLLAGGAREFVIAYARLKKKDEESVLLKKLDELARVSYWIKETFARDRLAGRVLLRESAPSVAVAFECLANAIGELKLALAHFETPCVDGPKSEVSPDTSGKDPSMGREGTRLLAAAQMFLWTVEGAIKSDPLSAEHTPRESMCELQPERLDRDSGV